MHYVVVPEPVTPLNVAGKPYTETVDGKPQPISPVSLHYYIMRYVIGEVEILGEGTPSAKAVPKMGTGYQGARAIRKLDRLLEKTKPGDVVAVEDADWDRVKKIIDEMNFNPPHFGAALAPIADAWMQASESKDDAEKAAAQMRPKFANGEGGNALPAILPTGGA